MGFLTSTRASRMLPRASQRPQTVEAIEKRKLTQTLTQKLPQNLTDKLTQVFENEQYWGRLGTLVQK